MPDLSKRLSSARGLLMVSNPAAGALLQSLCAACVDLLEVDGAGISSMTEAGGGGILGTCGVLAPQVEEWQFSLGEGPCREAFLAGVPVLVESLTADPLGHARRWPVFAKTIEQAGIRAIFAFPLRVDGRGHGAMTFFRLHSGALSSEQMVTAGALAEYAGPLIQLLERALLEDADETLYRNAVHQASGMIAAQLNVTAAEAFVRLRARAYAEGRTVSAFAADVVARRLRFTEDDL